MISVTNNLAKYDRSFSNDVSCVQTKKYTAEDSFNVTQLVNIQEDSEINGGTCYHTNQKQKFGSCT